MQAQCPSCGSFIVFKSQSSLYVVCLACQTLVVRKDRALEPVGKVADLQQDGSLLRVGTQGSFQGKSFEIVGRIQLALGPKQKPDALWNEWYATFSNGVGGWIGEALGEYFVSFAEPGKGLPDPSHLPVGKVLELQGTRYVVTSSQTGSALSFEGELPFVMETGYQARFIDLSSVSGLSATIDYSENPPLLFRGQWCSFEELSLRGLRVEPEEGEGPRLSAANLKPVKCPQCGAPHELRAGGLSQTLVCGFCDTVMDLNQDATFRQVIQYEQSANRIPAVIPLGTEGKLPGVGKPMTAIGFMRRSCVVEGQRYWWSEYLLYEPTVGYRWLTETNGHWTLLAPLHRVPANFGGNPVGVPGQETLTYEKTQYKHFQRTHAEVMYVAGEFYWRVRNGDASLVDDFVAPPQLLSADVSKTEVNWSHGTYLTGDQIWRAFGLKGTVLGAHGVANNQPNPHAANVRRRWLTYFGALAACFVFLMVREMSQPPKFFEQTWSYRRDEPEHSHLADVEIPPGVHNVRLTVIAPQLIQRWAFFQLTLIDEKKNLAYDTGATLYQESGVDEGEHWAEGKTQDSVMLSQIPGGKYLLRVDPQSNVANIDTPEGPDPNAAQFAAPLFGYTVRLERDVAQWGYFWTLLIFGIIPPLWSLWRSSSFETSRWSQSDHAPEPINWSSDDDD